MWNSAVAVVVDGIEAAFSWMGQIFEAVPGSWSTVFTVIVILILSRFLLGPLLGASFSLGSDKIKRVAKNTVNEMKDGF